MTIFDQIRGKKILIIGDAMIDRYLWGDTHRISPEAPVPILLREHKENRPGGAANVALNAKQLDMNVGLVSITGTDENEKEFLKTCHKAGIDHLFLVKSPERITSVKTRILARQQHLLRVDHESLAPLSSSETKEAKKMITHAFESCKPEIVILQDYNKGFFTPEIINFSIDIAKDYDSLIAVDPKKEHFFEYSGVNLFKPNLSEFRTAIGSKLSVRSPEFLENAQQIRHQLEAQNLLITLSDEGILYANENEVRIASTRSREIVDVCGAGDAVITLASAALSCGLPLSEIASLCNIAGGQVCSEVGVSPLRPNLIAEEFQRSIQ